MEGMSYEEKLQQFAEAIRRAEDLTREHYEASSEWSRRAESEEDPRRKIQYTRAAERHGKLYYRQFAMVSKLNARARLFEARYAKALAKDRIRKARMDAKFGDSTLL